MFRDVTLTKNKDVGIRVSDDTAPVIHPINTDFPEHPELTERSAYQRGQETVEPAAASVALAESAPPVRQKQARKRYSCGDHLRFFSIEISTTASLDASHPTVNVKVLRAK